MVVINNRSSLETDPIRNFRFLVTFIPHRDSQVSNQFNPSMGFTSVSGLAVTTDSIPYREGGYNTTFHQIPGQTSFSPLTLQRGVAIGTKQNWQWMRKLFRTIEETDGANNYSGTGDFRFDLEVAVLSHPIPGSGLPTSGNAGASDDHVALRFHVYNCWLTSLAYSDLNAGDNAIFVEQMAIVHEGFDVKWADSLTSTAGTY
jgi:phage tail-like protein